ncbi:MAG: hypothetical protein ACYCZR_01050 [Burkholderiales bacterium]
MILREPVTLTYVLISVLILAFSGELFEVFRTKQERDCHARNERLLLDGAQGPIEECK